MRCPQCGHWNRANYPRCFQCGAELPQDQAAEYTPPAAGPASKIYIQINEEGQATPSMDERDKLASEMKDLAARKKKGEIEMQRLRESGAKQGFAPTGRTVQTLNGFTGVRQQISRTVDGQEIEGDVRPDAIPVKSQRIIEIPDIQFDSWKSALSRLLSDKSEQCVPVIDDDFAVLLTCTLDLDSGDVSVFEFLFQEFTNLDVFVQKITKFSFVCVPSGFPVTDNADAHADRANFLSHSTIFLPYFSSETTTVMWLVLFKI